MMNEPDGRFLLRQVVEQLERAEVAFALIGASALAVHGVSRSTLDIDLLATDRRLLDRAFWHFPPEVTVDIRTGDASDPLAGVIRVRSADARDVDVIIGRSAWQAEAIERAEPARSAGVEVRAVRVEDLILLKLYAGGSQDRWDIEQLLAGHDRATIVSRVDARIGLLPPHSQRIWRKILDES